MNPTLQAYVTPRLIVLHQDDTAYSAARAMKENNIGCVLVCNKSSRLVGIFTDRDLVLRAVCEGFEPKLVPLASVMTRDPVTISEDKGISDAAWLMRSLGLRRIPIVANSQSGRLPRPLGIITLDDLLLQANERLELRGIVRKQLKTKIHRQNGYSNGAYSVSPEFFHETYEAAVGESHQARATQSLGKMIRLARQCLEEHGVFALDRENILNGLKMFMCCLVRRVLPGAAMNFIAQLPSNLQEFLTEQPAGPDVSINSAVMERAIRRAMKIKATQSAEATIALAETLLFAVSRGEIEALCAQLPKGIKTVFAHAMIEDRFEFAS